VPLDVVDEQTGDEEAGQHEEDVDAEEAAAEPGRADVEGDDGEYRDGTDPVEGVDSSSVSDRHVRRPKGVAGRPGVCHGNHETDPLPTRTQPWTHLMGVSGVEL
jgi:hypothetical protein